MGADFIFFSTTYIEKLFFGSQRVAFVVFGFGAGFQDSM